MIIKPRDEFSPKDTYHYIKPLKIYIIVKIDSPKVLLHHMSVQRLHDGQPNYESIYTSNLKLVWRYNNLKTKTLS